MKRYIFAAVGALFLGWSVAPVQAETICGQRAEILEGLAQTYAEVPNGIGVAADGAVIEILLSPTGSFTIIMTQPSGVSCLMLTGDTWEDLPKQMVGLKV